MRYSRARVAHAALVDLGCSSRIRALPPFRRLAGQRAGIHLVPHPRSSPLVVDQVLSRQTGRGSPVPPTPRHLTPQANNARCRSLKSEFVVPAARRAVWNNRARGGCGARAAVLRLPELDVEGPIAIHQLDQARHGDAFAASRGRGRFPFRYGLTWTLGFPVLPTPPTLPFRAPVHPG